MRHLIETLLPAIFTINQNFKMICSQFKCKYKDHPNRPQEEDEEEEEELKTNAEEDIAKL